MWLATLKPCLFDIRSLRSPLRALDSDTLATQVGWLRLVQKSPENRRSDGTKTDPL
jgi:hypothetical protein